MNEQEEYCQQCRLNTGILVCEQCNVLYCGDCLVDKHQIGTLSKHSFQLPPPSTPPSPSPSIGSPCPLCHKSPSDTYCNMCESVFCSGCFTSFHSLGSLQTHRLGPDTERVSHAPRPRNIVQEQAQTKLVPTRSSASNVFEVPQIGQVLSGTEVITFRIDSFGLGVSLQALLEMQRDRQERKSKPMFLSINCQEQFLKVLERKASSTTPVQLVRPLSLLQSGKISQVDPRQLSITFKKHRFNLEIYAQNAAEAAQIAARIQQLRNREHLGFTLHEHAETTQPWLTLPALKKGKLKSSSRHVCVSGQRLEVYRSSGQEDEIAVNSVDLPGVSVSREGKRSLVVSGVQKDLSFRLDTVQDRELLFAVLEEAGATRTSDQVDVDPLLSAEHLNSSVSEYQQPQKQSEQQQQSEPQNLLQQQQLLPTPVLHRSVSHDSSKECLSVFALMNLLRTSLEDECSLTPVLSLPKAIWTHSNVKIPAYQEKKKHFTTLNENIKSVVALAQMDPESFEKSLVEFVSVLEGIQNALSIHLSYVHGVKKHIPLPKSKLGYVGHKMKKYGHSLVKKATRATISSVKLKDDSYQATVFQILVQAQIFESLSEDADVELGQLRDVLDRIQRFFRDVFCIIIVTDLRHMVQRYVKDVSKALYE